MNTSYKRYVEPTTFEALTSSIFVGAIATYVTYPIEVIKTVTQVRSEGIGIRQVSTYAGYNPHKILRELHETGIGWRGINKGISVAVFGRSYHLFWRNLIYKKLYDWKKPFKPTNDLTYREKSVIAGFSGAVAALFSNPIDVVVTRIQAFHQISKRIQSPDLKAFYNELNVIPDLKPFSNQLGLGANVLKALLLNIFITYPYNDLLERCNITFGDIQANRWIAMTWGALVATVLVLPVDLVKTRLQTQCTDPALNRITYSGIMDCAVKIYNIESGPGFYAGFYAFYLRTYVYGMLTVHLMDLCEYSWKSKAGLPKHFW